MLGFLGTVTGMILAFYQMSTAETITPSLLAGGIYQALLTTAFGLGVGDFTAPGFFGVAVGFAAVADRPLLVCIEAGTISKNNERMTDRYFILKTTATSAIGENCRTPKPQNDITKLYFRLMRLILAL